MVVLSETELYVDWFRTPLIRCIFIPSEKRLPLRNEPC